MRRLRFARVILVVSILLWGVPLLLAALGANEPYLFGIGMIGMVVMLPAALACFILQLSSRRT